MYCSQVKVEPKAAVVREEEARAQEKAAAAKAIKDECEADLAEVRLITCCHGPSLANAWITQDDRQWGPEEGNHCQGANGFNTCSWLGQFGLVSSCLSLRGACC